MNERPTPITDANTCLQNKIGALTIEPEICRRLERERDEAREQIAAMKEAIREAHSALNNAAGKLANPYGICQDQTSDEYAAGLDCENALAKLQPFLDQ